MSKRQVSNLDLKIKLTKEYLDNGGLERVRDIGFLKDLMEIKTGSNGKPDPETVSPRVNSFMMALLASHSLPPIHNPEYISEYRSTLQKSNSFRQENIDTIEQFDNIYDIYGSKRDTLFRGQREAKWRLYSTLQRHWITERLFEKQNNYEEIISKLVENGKSDFGTQIKKILVNHNIDTLNSISILGFLQHHGCPTPLLDWTYSFKNALFFAIEKLVPNKGTIEIENYFSVYHIEEKYFENSSLRAIMEKDLSKIEQPMLLELISEIAKDEKQRIMMEKHFSGRKLFDRKKLYGSGFMDHMTKIKHLITIPLNYFSDKDIDSGILFSLNNSENILNQQGVFTWNSDQSKPIELVGDEQSTTDEDNQESGNYWFCSCLNINKKLSEHIINRLKQDGITKDFIYPTSDLDTYSVYTKSIKTSDNNKTIE